jgi:hypothetical protein
MRTTDPHCPAMLVTRLGVSKRALSGCSTYIALSLDIDWAQVKLKLLKHKIKRKGEGDGRSLSSWLPAGGRDILGIMCSAPRYL